MSKLTVDRLAICTIYKTVHEKLRFKGIVSRDEEGVLMISIDG
jgi:hypothetical protein